MRSSRKVVRDLTEGNLYKNYILYALPLILSSLLSTIYSTVDAMMAGKFISPHALGAISATSSFSALIQSFFNGVASGFAVYVAILFGKRNYEKLKRDVINMTVFVCLMAIVICVLCVTFRAQILDYLQVDTALRTDAETYFTIDTVNYVLIALNLTLIMVLYSLGITTPALYASISSSLIHIGGNLVAVLVLKMGVEGLAYSTILSRLTATAVYVTILIHAFRELVCEKHYYKFGFSCVTDSLRYTIPTAIQKVSFFATDVLIAPAINGLGADVTTGYSVMNRMYNICAQSFWNTCTGLDCYTAQCVGKGAYQKLNKGLLANLWVNMAILTPVVILFTVFAEPIASIFFPAGYIGDAFGYAIRFFKVYSLFLYVNMVGHLMHSYMRSIGKVTTVLWITVFGGVVKVAATLLLVPRFHIDGVYIGQSLSWLADGAMCVVIYFLLYYSQEKIRKIVEKVHKKE